MMHGQKKASNFTLLHYWIYCVFTERYFVNRY